MSMKNVLSVAAIFVTLAVAAAGLGWGAYRSAAAAGSAATARGKPTAQVLAEGKTDLLGDPLPPGVTVSMGSIRLRHGAVVTALASSPAPANAFLVSAGQDGTIRVWEAATGKKVRRLQGHKAGDHISVALSPNGKTLASVGFIEPTIRLWDVTTGKQIGTMGDGPGAVPGGIGAGGFGPGMVGPIGLVGQGQAGLAFSPDGKILAWVRRGFGQNAVGGGPHIMLGPMTATIVLWDVAAKKAIRKLELGQAAGEISCVAFSPDGKQVAAGVNVMSLNLQPPGKGMIPGGGFAGAGGGGFAGKPGGGNPAPAKKPPANGGGGNGFAGGFGGGIGGPAVPLASKSYSIVLWNCATGKEQRRLKGHKGAVHGLAYHRLGKGLVAVCDESDAATDFQGGPGRVRVWNPATGQETRDWKASRAGAVTLAFSGDHKNLATGSWDGFAIWDFDAGDLLHRVPLRIGLAEGCPHLAFSPNGKAVAVASHNAVHMYDVADASEALPNAGHAGSVTHISFAADSKTLLTSGADPVVCLWETATGKRLRRFSGGAFSAAASLAPSGKVVATVGASGPVVLYDAETGKELRQLGSGDKHSVFSSAFSPDSNRLAAISMKTGQEQLGIFEVQLTVWDVHKGRKLREISRKDLQPNSEVVFAPDGKTLAVSDGMVGPNTVRLLDAASLNEVHRLGNRQDAPGGVGLGGFWLGTGNTCMAFSGNGAMLVVGYSQPTVVGMGMPGMPGLAGVAVGGAGFLGNPAAQGTRSTGLVVWQPATGKEIGYLARDVEVRALAVSTDGRMIATADGLAAKVQVWEVATGKKRGEYKVHDAVVTALQFTPDGKALASGSADTTVLLRDLSVPLERAAHVDLGNADQRERLWADLRGDDAAKAFTAMALLSRSPRETITLLKDRLAKLKAFDLQRASKLIGDLDSGNFATRQRATKELRDMGNSAEHLLRRTLAQDKVTLEGRRRIEKLLQDMTLSTETLVTLRGVELLERLATPEARKYLFELSQGAADTVLTRAAESAVGRLRR
jgi:WD40 repeat protein